MRTYTRRINMTKYIGRVCEACRITSELDRWTLTEEGLKCPKCGHVKGQSSQRVMNSKLTLKGQITIEDAEAAQLREDLRAFRASLRGEVTQ
ncbi:MAG: hypothetical protein WCD81_10400 [Candidatus Bathyarchaeia archaeon]